MSFPCIFACGDTNEFQKHLFFTLRSNQSKGEQNNTTQKTREKIERKSIDKMYNILCRRIEKIKHKIEKTENISSCLTIVWFSLFLFCFICEYDLNVYWICIDLPLHSLIFCSFIYGFLRLSRAQCCLLVNFVMCSRAHICITAQMNASHVLHWKYTHKHKYNVESLGTLWAM